jgi:F-type H+-transporting ATPase subunit gamma
LLPLDNAWRNELAQRLWPSRNLPEVMSQTLDGDATTLRALIREYLFVSLFQASAESLITKTPADWLPCSAPTRTSTNCWRT